MLEPETMTFRDLIDRWGTISAFADDMDVPYVNAQQMRRRNSINPDLWPRLMAAARGRDIKLDLDRLLQIRAISKAEKEAAE